MSAWVSTHRHWSRPASCLFRPPSPSLNCDTLRRKRLSRPEGLWCLRTTRSTMPKTPYTLFPREPGLVLRLLAASYAHCCASLHSSALSTLFSLGGDDTSVSTART